MKASQSSESTVGRLTSAIGPAALRHWLRFADWTMLSLVAMLVLMVVVFTLASPYFLSVRNFLNIGNRVAIYGIVAVGLTIAMIAGGLDLTVGSVMMAASMVSAMLIKGGTAEWIAAVAGCLTGLALGVLNGLVITKGRINPIIATLGTASIIRGVGYVVSDGQNISIGMQRFGFLARGKIVGIPTAFVWWLLACALGFFILRYTLLGQYFYAIGGNPEACRVSGVRVDLWRFVTYLISGVVAGFSGVLLLSQSALGSPYTMAGAELDILAGVILGGIGLGGGGKGGILGTILGTVILGMLRNGMTLTGVPAYWQTAVRGVAMVIAVTLDSLRKGGGYR